ncbi:MAG TPA: tRNA (adenosine(37)-N6)-threonylcarbamoyltransferase complex dimerization subunit type 1 TsaB [Treponemataceae bacterium]|nr:tRNA (adenosine(37)-N6)-threonylcarbamoyltransferase complex dimerization subunit type 1 TsaB [Treponemataceae bacterium]
MKALAIDGATNTINFLACNGDKKALLSLDLAMKQSEKLLPSIDFVLKEVDLEAKDLEFTAVSLGPGTFTGLRLAFAALKALSLSFQIPLYAISSLVMYAKPFLTLEGLILPAIDAKKNRFYTSFYRNGKKVFDEMDISAKDLVKKLDPEEKIFCVGPDAKMLSDALLAENAALNIQYLSIHVSAASFYLLEMAGELYKAKSPPLMDWEGPFYLRASEAEENKAGLKKEL